MLSSQSQFRALLISFPLLFLKLHFDFCIILMVLTNNWCNQHILICSLSSMCSFLWKSQISFLVVSTVETTTPHTFLLEQLVVIDAVWHPPDWWPSLVPFPSHSSQVSDAKGMLRDCVEDNFHLKSQGSLLLSPGAIALWKPASFLVRSRTEGHLNFFHVYNQNIILYPILVCFSRTISSSWESTQI